MFAKKLTYLVFICFLLFAFIQTGCNADEQQISKRAKKTKSDRWSIGYYEGDSPFSLGEPQSLKNPVLNAAMVTDIRASFVADPFVIKKDNVYYLFFEVLNTSTKQGDIAYATSTDLKLWNYQKVVLNENFHLSYPLVFLWQNEYYMIPETHADLSVRLYKAKKFPTQWELSAKLISGYHYVDNTIFRAHNKWWMFVSTDSNDLLNLYYSDNLTKDWKAHPKNPIVRLNKHVSRPSGKVFEYENKLYRVAQDDYPYYGLKVSAFEIVELTDSTYQEQMILKPIIKASGINWNANGMHHVDLHQIENKWIAIVDGHTHN